MSTNHTHNYSLSQWERTDKVLMDDFNADNAKIDAALAGKADKSALNALSQTVSGHTAALAGKGNCRVWTTTYTGTGTYGSEHPTTLTFPGTPLFVAIGSVNNTWTFSSVRGVTTGVCQRGVELSPIALTWSGNSLTMRANGDTIQMNVKNAQYQVVAFIAVS